MDTAVSPPIEETVPQAWFTFTEDDLRLYHYSTRSYATSRGWSTGQQITTKQVETCHEMNRKLDKELVRICEFQPPAKNRTGTLLLSVDEANLLEDALRFGISLNNHSVSFLVPALARFQQDTRLLLAVLASETQQEQGRGGNR